MADDESERPLLTEMAEKLRQARGSSFSDRPEPGPPGDGVPHRHDGIPQRHEPPTPARPAPARVAESDGPDPLQVSLRIDSLERRLFELRAALEDAGAAPVAPAVAGRAPAPADAAAWIAFAAAAMSEYDDVKDQADAADQLLAEYRARRVRGGLLGGEA